MEDVVAWLCFASTSNPSNAPQARRATAAAAYRAGERIRDERTGIVTNHSRRRTSRTRRSFCRPDSVTREWSGRGTEPVSGTRRRPQRSGATRELRASSKWLCRPNYLRRNVWSWRVRLHGNSRTEYGTAVDLAIHDPKADGDPRNFHAHLLTTTREVTPAGLGAKAGLDMAALERAKRGLPTGTEQFTAVRERWAALMNGALRDANVEARVDHRSLAAQGIDRQPIVHIPMEFYRGKVEELDPAVRARLREQYRARVAARAERSTPLASSEQTRVLDGKSVDRGDKAIHTSEKAIDTSKNAAGIGDKPLDTRSVAEIRRDAVQAWLRMRPRGAESSAEERTARDNSQEQHEHGPGPEKGRESHVDREPVTGYEPRTGRESHVEREPVTGREPRTAREPHMERESATGRELRAGHELRADHEPHTDHEPRADHEPPTDHRSPMDREPNRDATPSSAPGLEDDASM